MNKKVYKATVFAILIASFTGPGTLQSAQKHIIENFEYSNSRLFRKNWKLRKKSRKTAHKIYNIKTEKGNRYLHANTTGNVKLSIMMGKLVGKSSGLSAKGKKWKIRYFPNFSWRWRIKKIPAGANERKKKKNDSAAAIYIAFQKIRIPFLSWKYQPVNVIKYVWSSTLPVGTIYKRNFKAMGISLYHLAYIVVRSGNKDKGKWITEKRDVMKDYRRAFGKYPAFNPIIMGILTDSNATKSTSIADYDDFIALPVQKP